MHYRNVQFGPGRITEGIKWLMIVNAAIYFFGEISQTSHIFAKLFGIVPYYSWAKFYFWQPFTYLFLHGSLMHLGMNMLVLWMFGSELEMIWGKNAFLKYYFITGVGAGLLTILFQPFNTIPVIGASGAIYGVLLAYGMKFPEREVYVYFVMPVKVKYFVAIIGVIAFMSSISPQGDNIAHLTHLSGMIIGYILLRKNGFTSRRSPFNHRTTKNPIENIKEILKKYSEMNVKKRDSNNIGRSELKAEVDEILEKINKIGYEGLNEAEKKRLLDASNHLSNYSQKD